MKAWIFFIFVLFFLSCKETVSKDVHENEILGYKRQIRELQEYKERYVSTDTLRAYINRLQWELIDVKTELNETTKKLEFIKRKTSKSKYQLLEENYLLHTRHLLLQDQAILRNLAQQQQGFGFR